MKPLGNKFECYQCRTKFYDLGKSEALCPKCGANQKAAHQPDVPHAPRPHRGRVIEIPDDDHLGAIDEDAPPREEPESTETSLEDEIEREERVETDESEDY